MGEQPARSVAKPRSRYSIHSNRALVIGSKNIGGLLDANLHFSVLAPASPVSVHWDPAPR